MSTNEQGFRALVLDSASEAAIRVLDCEQDGSYAPLDCKQANKIRKVATRFSKASGDHPCLVILGPLEEDPGRVERSTAYAVVRCCTKEMSFPERPTRTINVVLDTPGGSLDTAYKTVLYLSRWASALRVFVPRRAKSAGTLIAIGANELFMGPFGELGPLDTQIPDPRNPTGRVSALDCYQSVDYVRSFGLETLGKALYTLAKETVGFLPVQNLIATSATFSLGSISPMLSQVQPVDFGGWGRTLNIGEVYTQKLLTRVGYDGYKAREIARRLVYGYTHHPFPIDLTEAKLIGLHPQMMTEEQYESSREMVELVVEGSVVDIVDKQAPEGAPDEPVMSTQLHSDRHKKLKEDVASPLQSSAAVR